VQIMFRECEVVSFLSERQIRTKMWTVLCLKGGEIVNIKTRGYVAFVTKQKPLICAEEKRSGFKHSIRRVLASS
jgi:hypothetical protein